MHVLVRHCQPRFFRLRYQIHDCRDPILIDKIGTETLRLSHPSPSKYIFAGEGWERRSVSVPIFFLRIGSQVTLSIQIYLYKERTNYYSTGPNGYSIW